jgi:DNA-binding transcriptional MerR regulator
MLMTTGTYRCPERGCPVTSASLRIMVAHARAHREQIAAGEHGVRAAPPYAWHGDPVRSAIAEPAPAEPAFAEPGPGELVPCYRISALAGVSRNALLHYEAAGMIPPVPRNSRGYRRYTTVHLAAVRRVRAQLASGLTFAQIAASLSAVAARAGLASAAATVPPAAVAVAARAGLASAAAVAPSPAGTGLCACSCGAAFSYGPRPGRRYATDACRKRAQRRDERAELTARRAADAPVPDPEPVTARPAAAVTVPVPAAASAASVTSLAQSLASVS